VIDHDPIAPPPSLADILSGGEDLIGRVDFGARLVPETAAEIAAEAPAAPARQGTPRVAAKPALKAAAAAEPVAEPIAEEPIAEQPIAEQPIAPRAKRRTSAKATIRPVRKRGAAPLLTPVAEPAPEPEDQLDDEFEDEPEQVEGLEESYDELPSLDERSMPGMPRSFTEPAPRPASYSRRRQATYTDAYADPYADPYAEAHPRRRELPTRTASSTVPEEDVAYLGLSIDEVAESARVRMRAAEAAHLRHLEAIELEAARRLELLTAQAELDAELIRLHARREAHAIVTAARTRTGSTAGPSRAERRLADVGGSFSRFAETLESTLESSLAPDPRSHR
jgi:hypothetical protein